MNEVKLAIQAPSFSDLEKGNTGNQPTYEYIPPTRKIDTQYKDFDSTFNTTKEASGMYEVPSAILHSSQWYSAFGVGMFLSVIMAVIILYSGIRYMQIRVKEREIDLAKPRSFAVEKLMGKNAEEAVIITESIEESSEQKRLASIGAHLKSDNAQEWRAAIMEADILLNELLGTHGYQGESIGERLKGIQSTQLRNIELAWKAHKVRNAIAHQGSTMELSQKDASNVVALYKQVFKELGLH